MRCTECGADVSNDQTCRARFEALLASDYGGVAEAAAVHALTVLTYQLQHPSGVKPWYLASGYDVMRRIFGRGEDWRAVLQGVRQASGSDIGQRWKQTVSAVPAGVVTSPVPGEMTIGDIDPAAPVGHADRVLAWARSVARGRVGVNDSTISEQ